MITRDSLRRDYSRKDDYSPDDAEWISLNMLHATHDQEVCLRTGDLRHRDWARLGPWMKGAAP